MRNRFTGKLVYATTNGGSGGGTVAVSLQPAANREWIIQTVSVTNTDGANRDCYIAITDGTDTLAFAAHTIGNGAYDILEPFLNRNLRSANDVYVQVKSDDTWTDRTKCSIHYTYLHVGGTT